MPDVDVKGRAAQALSLDDRLLTYDELVAAKDQLALDDLLARLRDGRGIVRANAALGLAAIDHAGGELVPFLRDTDRRVAQAAAQAFARLGLAHKSRLAAIAAALDGARPEVVDTVLRMFSEYVGKADAELISVLDSASEVAADAIVDACERVGIRGLHLLQAAARDDRALVRINALRGIASIGHLEQSSSMEVLVEVEREDRVSDVRAAARRAISALAARSRAAVTLRRKMSEPQPPVVPELEQRAMTPPELARAAEVAPLEELLRGLDHPRVAPRLNAVRVLALKGQSAAGCAGALQILLRDPDATIRVEVAQSLGKLGPSAVVAAPALVRALGDADPAVIAAAEAALADFGDAAAPALVAGLDAPTEPHGARVAALLGKLANGADLLRGALESTSVDARVHAALGLAALGKARAGAVLPILIAGVSNASNNARARWAFAKAIAILDPKAEKAAPRIDVDGFESRSLTDADLAKSKAQLAAAGIAGLAPHMNDARANVRANTALALATLGADALPAVDSLALLLRDDAPEVRLAAARAIDKLGDGAVEATATDLVRGLRTGDAALAAQIASMFAARPANAALDQALARGLDAADARTGEKLVDAIVPRPRALDLFYDAWLRPTGQVHAARGFSLLGRERIGRGRELLEAARASSSVQTRQLALAALRSIEEPPAAPEVPAVPGFETSLLDATAFAGAKPDAARLVTFLQDGRPVVRANATTAIGVLGAAAAHLATTVATLLRDDDDRVRIAAASALDKLGDDAVIGTAANLVDGLRARPRVADACKAVLASRKGKVEAALLAGLETSDEAQGLRIAELVCALPNARELLFVAFDGPAQNVQINAALGIGLLGAKGAGPAGRARLVNGLTGPFTRRREAMVKALALLGPE